jgi:hypothetical protein
LRVHHSKLVKQWLKENAEKIEVFYPPSYWTELNPEEPLNANLKQRVTAGDPAKPHGQLVKITSQALRSIQKHTARVERYFLPPDVRYALSGDPFRPDQRRVGFISQCKPL